jgi:hypothetical protein
VTRRASLAAAALLAASAAASADEAKPVLVSAGNAVVWKPATGLPKGAMIAVIAGDPGKPGPYVVRLKLPARYVVPAHRHPTVENVTVLSGGFRVAVGEAGDSATRLALGPGGFVSLPLATRLRVWTTKNTVLQVHGIGPLKAEYVDPKDDPSQR